MPGLPITDLFNKTLKQVLPKESAVGITSWASRRVTSLIKLRINLERHAELVSASLLFFHLTQ